MARKKVEFKFFCSKRPTKDCTKKDDKQSNNFTFLLIKKAKIYLKMFIERVKLSNPNVKRNSKIVL